MISKLTLTLALSALATSCAHHGTKQVAGSTMSRGIASVHPTCLSNNSDPDRDGFGWENNATCVVAEQTTAQTNTATQANNNQSTNNAACIDPDGDGWGWDGTSSCRIENQPTLAPAQTNPQPTAQTNPSGHPPCTGGLNTPGGYVLSAGQTVYGWQNNATCIVTENSNNSQTTPAVQNPPTVQTPTTIDNSQAPSGQLLYSANFTPSRKQHSGTHRCVRQDRNNPRSINYDSLYYAGDYLINSNPWNASVTDYPYEQCILENDNPGWTFNWGGQNDFMSWGHVWDVRSYPEVTYGVKRGDNNGAFGEYSHGSSVNETRAKTGLPVYADRMPDIIIDLDYTASNSGDFNVSIESFFHSSCDNIVTQRPNSNMQYEVMLWLDIGEFKPAGPDGYVGDTTIDNIPVEVWTKDTNNLHYLAFVVKEGSRPLTRKAINWTKFLEFAKNEGHKIRTTNLITNRPTNSRGGWNRRTLQNHYCLANILIGTEIWNGQGSFKLNKYQIRQYKK